jgi:hypothetical protein
MQTTEGERWENLPWNHAPRPSSLTPGPIGPTPAEPLPHPASHLPVIIPSHVPDVKQDEECLFQNGRVRWKRKSSWVKRGDSNPGGPVPCHLFVPTHVRT